METLVIIALIGTAVIIFIRVFSGDETREKPQDNVFYDPVPSSVQVEALGKHVEDRLSQFHILRKSRYRAALEAHNARLDEIAVRRRESFLINVWYGLIGLPSAPQPESESHEERIWKAGMEGEAVAGAALRACLPDLSLLFSGYRNKKGEIDFICITEKYVLAVEIKNLNGAIKVNGDRWTRDKYDKYGNRVEVDLPIRDRGGRSPSSQLNEPADFLENFIRSRGHETLKIRRAVVLTHPNARLESVNGMTIDGVCHVGELARLLKTLAPSMENGVPVETVGRLVRKDHAFHSAPLPRRRAV